MKKELFFVEVGVLLDEKDPEFDCYHINGFFDDIFGFYDENRLTFLTYKKALEYALNYIENGVERTYAFIHNSICNIDDEQLKEIKDFASCEYSIENPKFEDVLFFAYKKEKSTDIIINRRLKK